MVASAALIPLIASAVTAAGTAYAANKASKSAGAMRRMIKDEKDAQQWLRDYGQDLALTGKEGLDKAWGYLNRLSSGNRSRVMADMGPQLADMADADTARMRAALEAAPAGGGVSAGYDPMAAEDRTWTAYLNARPNAMQKLAELSQGMSGAGQGALSGSTSAIYNLMGLQQRQNTTDWMNDQQIGEQVGGLLGQLEGIDWSGIFGRGGSTTMSPETSDYLTGLMLTGGYGGA